MQDTTPRRPQERHRIDGQGRELARVSGIGRPFGIVRSKGAEAGSVFVGFRDTPDVAAALALAVVMDKERPRVGWPAFPDDCRDRA